MTKPFATTQAAQVEISTVFAVPAATGAHVLSSAELLLVSGGAPRGTWLEPSALPESLAATSPDGAPRGTW